MRALLLLPLLLMACDPTSPGGDEGAAGSHALHVTGSTVLTPALDERPTGRALFAPVTVSLPGGGTARRFVVELQDAGPDPFLLLDLTFPSDARPAAGVYAAGGATGAAVEVTLVQSQASPSYTEVFDGEAGTVTLTESTAASVRGRLDVTLRTAGFGAPSGNVGRIQGTFSAVEGRL